jgi:hypothetical protein
MVGFTWKRGRKRGHRWLYANAEREREGERERGMGGRLARGGETWEGGPGTTRWRNGRGVRAQLAGGARPTAA